MPDIPDARELEAVLGDLDPVELLGAQVARVLFASGNLSRVVGVETTTGEQLVIKSRPDSPRLDAVAAVQAALHERGQAVPAPVGGVRRVDGRGVSVERLVPGGETLGPRPGAASAFARVLRGILRAAPDAAEFPELREGTPPWVDWAHDGASIWPARDTPGGDIRVPGPPDVDDLGAAARAVLRDLDRPGIITHADFEDQNLRWQSDQILVIHDWDSLAVLPECAAIGAVAAVWPAGVVAWCATVDQAEEFIAAYEVERGRPFDAEERRAAWAAALWHRGFNARKDAADGGGTQLDLFRRDAAALAERAGIG
jgi:hypothetical protein